MWHYWLIAAGIFFIAEALTAGFLIFWLGISALITMCVSFFVSDLIIQTVVFIICSVILIFATKPFVKKFMNIKETKTNVFSLIGKKAIVTKDIDSINSVGQIKVDGQIWSAEGEHSKNIETGTQVEILKINGVKAIVRPISSTSEK